MPNRIIKESICTSDTISKLSYFEEVCFYRLIVNADDYGRFDGRLAILKSRMFPLTSVTEKQIGDAINKLSSVGIVTTYEVQGKPYLQIVTWGDHQQIRNKRSKYPSLDEADDQLDGVSNQLKSIDIKSPRNPIQSNPNLNPNTSNSSEQPDGCPSQSSNVFIELPLNDKSLYAITTEEIDQYRELYPAVDVKQELRNMLGWLDANPRRRKTKSGIRNFVTSWLARTQNKGGSMAHPDRRTTLKRDNRDNFTSGGIDWDSGMYDTRMPRLITEAEDGEK